MEQVMPPEPLVYGLEPPLALFDLADAVRTVIERMMVIDGSPETLAGARRVLDDVARELEIVGRKGLNVRMQADTEPGPDDLRPYYAGDATRWHYNPIFPPLTVSFDADGVLRGAVCLGLPYEGPPGCVHGGILSLLLDQILGQVNLRHGLPAMTGALTVRYRRPTPLLAPLTLEADPPAAVKGRKHLTRGRILSGGVVTAEAEGLFVLPNFETRGVVLPHLRRADMGRPADRLRRGADDRDG
jgi:hypothetical protein